MRAYQSISSFTVITFIVARARSAAIITRNFHLVESIVVDLEHVRSRHTCTATDNERQTISFWSLFEIRRQWTSYTVKT